LIASEWLQNAWSWIEKAERIAPAPGETFTLTRDSVVSAEAANRCHIRLNGYRLYIEEPKP
jgi:hypothetical protein